MPPEESSSEMKTYDKLMQPLLRNLTSLLDLTKFAIVCSTPQAHSLQAGNKSRAWQFVRTPGLSAAHSCLVASRPSQYEPHASHWSVTYTASTDSKQVVLSKNFISYQRFSVKTWKNLCHINETCYSESQFKSVPCRALCITTNWCLGPHFTCITPPKWSPNTCIKPAAHHHTRVRLILKKVLAQYVQ